MLTTITLSLKKTITLINLIQRDHTIVIDNSKVKYVLSLYKILLFGL